MSACALVTTAASLKPHASERERALIDALATRYSGQASDRNASDRAYADAMRRVASSSSEQLMAMGRAGRRRVMEHYCLDRQAKALSEFIQEIDR